jgi:peptidylprolyl isomerase/FKBP-type peptidyl-prolyl cis-trans isomerase FklB
MRIVLICLAALSLSACGLAGKAPADPKVASANLKAGEAFLAANAKAEGVHVTASGLQYKVLRNGPDGGLRPKPADEVKVHYEGKLISGVVFDSSYERGVPASFPLEGLVPAWVEALQLMRPGDQWMLYVPPSLGYGDRDLGQIPPNSVLIFKIELLDVLPDSSSVQKG